MRNVISDSADFVYVADIDRISSPSGRFSLKIISIWRQAREPDAEHVKLALTLDRAALESLRGAIDQALRS